MASLNPSGFLFPLARLRTIATAEVEDAMEKLALIYSKGDDAQVISGRHGKARVDGSLARLDTSLRKNQRPKQAKRDAIVDSGYASAEEDESSEEHEDEDGGFAQALEIIRNDSLEREFAIRWLTGFIAGSSSWNYPADGSLSDEEMEEREALVEKAASLLSSCANVGEGDDKPLSRQFTFSLGSSESDYARAICVELNDLVAPEDHSSVGLQSWASSIHFARLMAEDPAHFGIFPDRAQRMLELGAGTGMLSIAAMKLVTALCRHNSTVTTEIVATDYHPDVLTNLQRNIESNLSLDNPASVSVRPFDWQYPTWEQPMDRPFDIILAADVVYDPCHAGWIKNCVSRLLKKPNPSSPDGGIFWMVIALRNTGRHEGLADAVFDVFPILKTQQEQHSGDPALKAVLVQDLERREGVGRKDEVGYRLLKICWA